MLILESLLTGEAAEAYPGDVDTGGSHLGTLFYVDTSVSKHHFGILSPAYEHQDPTPPSQHSVPVLETPDTKQLVTWRHSLTHQQSCCHKIFWTHGHPRAQSCPPGRSEHSSITHCKHTCPRSPRALQAETLGSALPTSGVALVPGPASPITEPGISPGIPGLWPTTWIGRDTTAKMPVALQPETRLCLPMSLHCFWDLLGLSPACQCADIGPLGLAARDARIQLHSLLSRQQAWPIQLGGHQPQGHHSATAWQVRTQPTNQQTVNRPENPWVLALPTAGQLHLWEIFGPSASGPEVWLRLLVSQHQFWDPQISTAKDPGT